MFPRSESTAELHYHWRSGWPLACHLPQDRRRGGLQSTVRVYCLVMSFVFTLPESPRWYFMTLLLPTIGAFANLFDPPIYRLKLKDRHDKARRVLETLHPGKQEHVDKELEDIELALRMSVNHAGLKVLFAMGPQRIFHRVLLASVVQIMLQVGR